MKIIGIGYRKASGKDTFANFLTTHLRCEHPGKKIKTVGFADAVKATAYQLYSWAGLKRGVFYESHYEAKEITLPLIGQSPRDFWIGVGNKLREVYPRTWLDIILKQPEVDVLIIKDVRFINEAQAIWDLHGFLVRIDRDVPRGTDPAETSLDIWDEWSEIIDNNGTFQELSESAIKFAEDYI